MTKIALVTGGNRGIDFETCRQLSHHGFQVFLGCRDLNAGTEAARAAASNGPVTAVELDVRNPAHVAALRDHIPRLDVLVNNAGTYDVTPFEQLTAADLADSVAVHMMGAFRLMSEFLPGMNAHDSGRIINVSSGGGTISDGVPGPAAYGIAKAALNALTLVAAKSAVGAVEINAICPGWVRTDMGGPAASRSVAQGADTIVWLATRSGERINGKFLRDREVIPW